MIISWIWYCATKFAFSFLHWFKNLAISLKIYPATAVNFGLLCMVSKSFLSFIELTYNFQIKLVMFALAVLPSDCNCMHRLWLNSILFAKITALYLITIDSLENLFTLKPHWRYQWPQLSPTPTVFQICYWTTLLEQMAWVLKAFLFICILTRIACSCWVSWGDLDDMCSLSQASSLLSLIMTGKCLLHGRHLDAFQLAFHRKW
jgi:hypothetical protein